jgi:ABC-type dipeptide/oligopeptide/nickel transport system permease component
MAKNKQTTPQSTASRLESFLGLAFIACVGITVISVLIILLAAFSNGSWVPVGLGMIPMLAMPVGFLIFIALLVSSSKRRKSEKIQTQSK